MTTPALPLKALFCFFVWFFVWCLGSKLTVSTPLKSFVDLLVWCCVPATYEQVLSAAGVAISDYQYFHSEKRMS